MSNKPNPIRKLVAVLFADIAGYTALMQADEPKALAWQQKFKEAFTTKVPIYQGEIIQFYGDACLAVFNSSVDAVACAKALQGLFLAEPLVPVRIGLHAGDVVFREDNVFGDAVNISSRIESMGIPGAVLLSESVRVQVKNQPDFLLTSLGNFEFKNVAEPITVYALCTEGLVVPSPEEVQGKIKGSKPLQNKINWLKPALIGLITFILMAFVFGLWKSNASPPDQTAESPLSEKIRQKRLVVLSFDNLTLDPSLDVFGQMISDWVTKGLMETGEANIINAANIRPKIATANLEQGANPKFAEATGVDLLLNGRYYLAEDQMIVNADITDVKSGEILHSLQLKKPRAANMDLLDELTREVISYWAVKEQKRFLQNPPKYEAYLEWMEADRLYTSKPLEATEHLQKAFGLDTTFYAPLFRLASLYARFGETMKIREILAYLENHQDAFTQWEKLSFAARKAILEANYLESALLTEKKYEMDPSDGRSNYNAAYLYNNANRPGKALELIQNYDRRFLNEEDYAISWRASQEAFAHFRLGNYAPVIQLAKDYPFPKMFTPLAVFHLQALVRMDSVNVLARQYEIYKQDGVYGPTGQRDPPDHLLVIICNELLLTGKEDLLKDYTRQLQGWLTQNKVIDLPQDQPDVFNSHPMRREELEGFSHFYLKAYKQAALSWEKEQIPESNWADLIERTSRLGVCYALLGEKEKAQTQLNAITSAYNEHEWFEANQVYYSSRILAAMRQQEAAVDALQQALNKGFLLFRPAVFTGDPFLKPLHGYAAFEELMRPKG